MLNVKTPVQLSYFHVQQMINRLGKEYKCFIFHSYLLPAHNSNSNSSRRHKQNLVSFNMPNNVFSVSLGLDLAVRFGAVSTKKFEV